MTRQKTFSVALKISELLSVSVVPWSGMAVLEVYAHGQAWPCTCYLSSPSLEALLERENALRWLTVDGLLETHSPGTAGFITGLVASQSSRSAGAALETAVTLRTT